MRALAQMLVVVVLSACGTKPVPVGDAGIDMRPVDAGADAGVDAGRPPPPPFDAGPPPPRTVFGSMTANGVMYELWTGYGSPTARTQQMRVGTIDTVMPRLQVSIVVPADAGLGPFTCGQPNVLLSAQYVTDAGVAYFTLNPMCTIAYTQFAAAINEEYIGTFSGSMGWEPRSALDAGFGTMTITGGNFRVKRTF